MHGDPVLRAQNLSKKFGAVAAVVDVSLVVRQGEIFGFLGPNGAGKTTTISMLLGLTHPSGGTVEILGERVTPGQTAVLHQVGTLVGDPALLMPFTARQNLRSLAYLYPEISDRRIDTILEEVGLRDAADRPARTLSTGMKQRLGLALALVTEPKLLILDEPANGLDPAGIHELRTLFRSMADRGVTIFLSSHQLHEVELICGRVAVVNRGSLVAEGTVAELTKRSGDRVAITTSETGRTAELLRLLPNARDISVTAKGLEVAGVPSELVLQHLVTHGATPKEVSVKHQDLEEMFLELTRSEPPLSAMK
jgi:ABC-2 type transport system ATP-binding protein